MSHATLTFVISVRALTSLRVKKNMNPPVYECGRIGTGTQLVVETFSNDLDLAFMMRSKHNMSKSVNNIIRE